jgi:hypothetical protein
VFLTSLIVLEGKGIDVIMGMNWTNHTISHHLASRRTNVIMGMNWMMRHKVVLDIPTRLVHLHSPAFGKISLQLPPVSHLQAYIHTVIAKSLDEILVVREYPDVFPDDLPEMPPDRAIEFKIE